MDADLKKNFIYTQIQQDIAAEIISTPVTRFPPEPNGYLHIGHAKSICLNYDIARDFGGVCNLRFDDTNPEKESTEFTQSIAHDIHWLGYGSNTQPKQTSAYFEKLYQFAHDLIQQGLAYVDFSSQLSMRNMRGTLTTAGENSPYRDTSIAANTAHFTAMYAGKHPAGSCVLRAKIDMASPRMSLRDPTIYRIKDMQHHATNKRWHVYPMYDFAHSLSDAIEGVTHSLCTLEFQDNRILYAWFIQKLTPTSPTRQYEFAKLRLEHTQLSKRKLQQLIAEGFVDGWDDPRMPTIAGMRKRGYPALAIRNFCNQIGVARMDNLVSYTQLESAVRDALNTIATRALVVFDPIRIVITNFCATETLRIARHPNNPDAGCRDVPFTQELYIERDDFRERANKHYKRLVLGKNVRLRGGYVIIADGLKYNNAGNVDTVYCHYDPTTLGNNPADGSKVRGVIHWVSKTQHIPIEVHLYQRLFIDAIPDDSQPLAQLINPDSHKITTAYAEPSIAAVPSDHHVQFERVGYFYKDPRDPDAHIWNRSVELKDNWSTSQFTS